MADSMLYKPAPAVTAAKKVGGVLPTLAKAGMSALGQTSQAQLAKTGAGLLQKAVTPQMAKPQMVNNLQQPSFSMTPPQSMGARAAFPGVQSQTSTPNTIGGSKQMQLPAQSPTPPKAIQTQLLPSQAPNFGSQQPTQATQQQQTYSAPAQTAQPQFNASAFTNTPQMQPPQQPTMPAIDNSYGGLIQQLMGQVGNTAPVDTANQQLQQLRNQYATAVGNIESQPIPLEFQQGRAQVLGRQYASQEAAAQSALTNAMGIRGQNIGAMQSAITAMQPRTLQGGQYQVSPTGQEIGAGFAGGLEKQRQVSNFDYNTQTGQNFAKMAAELEQPMQALHLVGQQVSQFIQQNGLNNQTSPMANQAINTYLAQANPAAYTSLVAAGTEAKNLIARIAGMGSDLVPTELTNAANAMNIENMTARDIQAFIEAVDALGQSRLSTMQQSAQAAQGGGYSAYSGATQGNPQAQLPSTPMPQYLMGNIPTTQNPLAQGGMGAGIGAGGSILAAGGAIAGFFSKLFK